MREDGVDTGQGRGRRREGQSNFENQQSPYRTDGDGVGKQEAAATERMMQPTDRQTDRAGINAFVPSFLPSLVGSSNKVGPPSCN